MCLIVYTLHALCQHRQYSSTFRCHIARGAEAHETTDYTMSETRFLPDVEHQPVHQEHETEPACPKRFPTRPVNTLCDACKRSQVKRQAFGEDHPVVASASAGRNFSLPFSSQPDFSQPSSSQPSSSQPSTSQGPPPPSQPPPSPPPSSQPSSYQN